MVPGDTHVPFAYCYRCPFKMTYPECDMYCVDFIQEQVLDKYLPPEDVAAFFIEPIQGEGGYVVPPPEYFKRLRKLLDKNGILMVDDEVQSGMGRTGRWFGIEHWGVEPDILCTSKALASGMPIGATVANTDVMDWEGGSHANTFGGNPNGKRDKTRRLHDQTVERDAGEIRHYRRCAGKRLDDWSRDREGPEGERVRRQ
jgi:4-aminobutyrate aminotransferase